MRISPSELYPSQSSCLPSKSYHILCFFSLTEYEPLACNVPTLHIVTCSLYRIATPALEMASIFETLVHYTACAQLPPADRISGVAYFLWPHEWKWTYQSVRFGKATLSCDQIALAPVVVKLTIGGGDPTLVMRTCSL